MVLRIGEQTSTKDPQDTRERMNANGAIFARRKELQRKKVRDVAAQPEQELEVSEREQRRLAHAGAADAIKRAREARGVRQ